MEVGVEVKVIVLVVVKVVCGSWSAGGGEGLCGSWSAGGGEGLCGSWSAGGCIGWRGEIAHGRGQIELKIASPHPGCSLTASKFPT